MRARTLAAILGSSENMAQSSIQLGPIGIWTRQLEDQPAAKAQETAHELEELGYGALWFGEAVGREALTNAGLLLSATKRIVIATGIANIYARDAVAMAAGQKTLAEAYPNRFLLGLGVSHIPLVEQLRGHRYEKPVATMRAYLEAMDQAPYNSVPPPTKPARDVYKRQGRLSCQGRLAPNRCTACHIARRLERVRRIRGRWRTTGYGDEPEEGIADVYKRQRLERAPGAPASQPQLETFLLSSSTSR